MRYSELFKTSYENQIASILLAQATVEENLRQIAIMAANIYVQSQERSMLTLANAAETQREYLRLQCKPWYEFCDITDNQYD